MASKKALNSRAALSRVQGLVKRGLIAEAMSRLRQMKVSGEITREQYRELTKIVVAQL
jgi:hypothetical protein